MTAQYSAKSFAIPKTSDLQVLVAMWRGAMLQCFAEVENAITDCLESIEKSGKPMPSESFHEAARKRLYCLQGVLENDDFEGFSKATLNQLSLWCEWMDRRQVIAHGISKQSAQQAHFVCWSYAGSGRGHEQRLELSPFDMLEQLKAVQKAAHELKSQFGQIKRVSLSRRKAQLR